MKKTFWYRNAGLYDRFMRKDTAAYEQMYALIQPVVRHKTVLELATGTGLIARHIVSEAEHIEATDASPEMIAQAGAGAAGDRTRSQVRRRADRADIHPRRQLPARPDQGLFHEAGRFPAAQQMVEQGVS